jgi:hypothetical protein
MVKRKIIEKLKGVAIIFRDQVLTWHAASMALFTKKLYYVDFPFYSGQFFKSAGMGGAAYRQIEEISSPKDCGSSGLN